MPLYHFNVMDGVADLDEDGMELPSLEAAWREARLLASGIIMDDGEWARLGDDWRIEVTDHDGMILFRLDVAALRSPMLDRHPTRTGSDGPE